MAKNLNQNAQINLTFRADSGQAKSQIVELQSLLNKVALGTDIKVNPAQMQQASTAAKELALHLNNAYNATTGNFDLSRLSRSLHQAGTDVSTLSTKLLNAGTTGQQAFVKLAQTIAAADRPMLTINGHLSQLWTTMKNTARWQLSSAALHGLISGAQQALTYVQDLNESLNNIRIVTGYSTDQMAKFAKEANKAAKALSTTTTEYTNASLIYYQQGLSEAEIKERTDVTIKMANVSRQSAEIVSDQMTAVWNNFDDGSKTLEYYADVMTALGAATASSTEEIAEGLEKFAAVADTVGLSYEYATAALATVTATTRQSADVVGTAFKTLFARIQDLELGETLDDGMTLGKYSEALKVIGVDILDANGNLRDMDDILGDMGSRWDQISKAQQVSVAQTVAGVRQYTQLIALMDNWEYFQENLTTVEGSSGALQEQAEIYEESWEAASNRAKASAEAIYDALLNDDFFIGLTDTFSGLLDSIGAFVDGLGGVKPLIFGIGSMLLGAFSGNVIAALQNFKSNMLITFQGAQKQADALATKMNASVNAALQQSSNASAGSLDKLNLSMETALRNTVSLNEAKSKYLLVEKNLTAAEKQEAETTLNLIQQYQQERQAVADLIVQLQQEQDLQMSEAGSQASGYEQKFAKTSTIAKKLGGAELQAFEMHLQNSNTAVSNLIPKLIEAAAAKKEFSLQGVGQDIFKSQLVSLDEFSTRLQGVRQGSQEFTQLRNEVRNFAQQLNDATGGAIPGLQNALKGIGNTDIQTLQTKINQITKALTSSNIPANQLRVALRNMGVEEKTMNKLIARTQQLTGANQKLKASQDRVNQSVKNFNPTHQITMMERMVKGAAALGQTAMLMTSFHSALDAIKNEDLSWGERLSTIFMSISMMVPAAIGAMKSFDTVLGLNITQTYGAAIANAQYTRTIKDQISQTSMSTIVKRINNGEDKNAILNGIAKSAVKKGLIKEEEKEGYIVALNNKLKKQGANVDKMSIASGLALTIQTKAEAIATNAETSAVLKSVAAWIAKQAAMAPVLVVTLLIVAALAALTAVVVGVVSGIKGLINWYNKDAIAAQQAKEKVEELKTAYEETKDAFENLKTSMTEYQEMQNTLDQLTEGTKEWNEALQESNAHIVEMLRQFPELAEYFDNQGGRYSFTDPYGAITAAEAELVRSEGAYNNAIIAANLTANQANKTSALRDKNIADTNNFWDFTEDITQGAAQGTVVGAAAGAAVGGIGALPGAIIGLISGTIGGVTAAIENNSKAADESEKAIEQLQQAYEDGQVGLFEDNNFGMFEEALGGISDDTIKALWDNREALKQLTQETAANTAQMKAMLEVNVKNANQNNEWYQKTLTEDEKALVDTIVATRGANVLSDPNRLKEKQDEIKDLSARQLGEEYLRNLYGDDYKKKYRFANVGGLNMTLEVYNENTGKWERENDKKEQYSKEYLRQSVLSNRLAQIDEGSDKPIFEHLVEIGDNLKKAAQLSSDQVLQIQQDLARGEGTSVQHLSPEQVKAIEESAGVSGEVYGKAYIDAFGKVFGEEYGTAIATAIQDYDSEVYWNNYIQQTVAEINAMFNDAAESLDMDRNALESYAGSLAEAHEKTIDLTNASAEERAEQMRRNKEYAKMAIAQYKLAKGINQVQKAWEENTEILKEGNEASLDYHEAIGALTTSLEEAFGMEVSATFVKNNLSDIEKMVKGGDDAVDALNRLRNKLNEEYILSLELEDDYQQALIGELNDLQRQLELDPLSTELVLDDEKAIEALNKALATGQATIQDIEAMFNNANLAMPEYKTKKVPGEVTTSTSTVTGSLFGGLIPYSHTSTTTTQTERTIPYFGDQEPIVTKDPGTGISTITDYGGGKVKVSGTGITQDTLDDVINYTGDNKSSSKKDAEDKTIKRYKTTGDQLEEISRNLERANKELDKMYGKARLDQMDKIIQHLKDERTLLEKEVGLSQEYIGQDLSNLYTVGQQYGIEASQWKINETTGNIDGYNDVMDSLYASYNKTHNEALLKQIEALEEAIDKYDDTRETAQEKWEAYLDKNDEILEENYNKLTETLELDLEISEASMQRLERQIQSLGDDLFARAEAANLMTSYLGTDGEKREDGLSGYAAQYKDSLTSWENYNTELDKGYEIYLKDPFAEGAISQDKYIEGLKKVQQGYWDNIDALREYKAEMKEYYADTLSAGDDEFQKYMEFMEHPTEVMEHYDNLLDLTGGEKDYAAKQVILDGVAETKKYQAESRKAYYEMLQGEADEQKRQLEALDPADAAYEYAKAEWEAAQKLANQAQTDMLSSMEDWAEAVNNALDNELAAAAEKFEKALTNGASFDELNTAMERTQSLQEEWLTTTNKIYETNKMMRTAQQALDKTTNQAAKNKLKTFIDQTQQLQDQEKLSEYELKLQQSRYDLLLAEIALEEAKNAKSTVRLQRDSEGNFGYVYTADQDKVADAEQAYFDADNALYNQGLEGYNKYTEKYLQTMQEFHSTITDINTKYRNGEYASEEEYNQALLDAQSYYGEQLANYTYLTNAGLMAQSYEQFNTFKTGWFAKQAELEAEGIADATTYYGELLGYAQGYNIEQAKQNTIFQDGWATTFGAITGFGSSWKNGLTVGEDGIFNQVNAGIDGMGTTANTWKEAMVGVDGEGGYLGAIKTAFGTYKEDITAINAAVGLSMSGDPNSVESRAGALKAMIGDENSGLVGTTKGYKDMIGTKDDPKSLLGRLQTLYTNTDLATTAFQNQLGGIETLETYYENLAKAIQTTIDKILKLNSLNGNNTQAPYQYKGESSYTPPLDDGDTGNDNPESNPAEQPSIKPTHPLPLIKPIPLDDSASDVDPPFEKGDKVQASDSVGSIVQVYNKNQKGKMIKSFGDFVSSKCLNDGEVGLDPYNYNGLNYYWVKFDGRNGWFNGYQLAPRFNTGGYTGEWGPEGKMAILDEKELVLNAQDTENMLIAISMVRDLMSMFDITSLSSGMTSPIMSNLNSNTLEQNVKIEASFPGVQDRYEIEEAFNNLINTASQFANRKRL